MSISLIVAYEKGRGIGMGNSLLWTSLPRDMRRFKDKTSNRKVVMGRKTFESIGRPLPSRDNIVLTRSPLPIPGAITIPHIDFIVNHSEGVPDEEIFVIGGAEIYRQFLPFADTVYVTEVYAEIEADAFFPELPSSDWLQTLNLEHTADDKNEYGMSFQTFRRRPRRA